MNFIATSAITVQSRIKRRSYKVEMTILAGLALGILWFVL